MSWKTLPRGERIESVEWARKRMGRLTFAVDLLRLRRHHYQKWCVVAARRYSGMLKMRGYRAVVAGPFETRKAADLVARELRTGRCHKHTDCLEHPALGGACLRATPDQSEVTTTERRGGAS